MGLFDKLINQIEDTVNDAAKKIVTNKTETFTFAEMPETLEAFKALPEASKDSEYKTAALTVVALCMCAADMDLGVSMMNFLKEPGEGLSTPDIKFIEERLAGKKYVPVSYIEGTTPENNYTPVKPYVIKVSSNAHSYDEDDYAQLWITSSGADNPRPLKLRKTKSGTWALWSQQLLPDIRKPAGNDPWA